MVKLNSFWQKLLLGESLLEKVDSPINGEIKVVENIFGRREMVVGGVCQSGELVERVWQVGIRAIRNTQNVIRNVLILGLGCGDAARLVAEKWPGCKIVGVEIDPKVVEIGKKYFGLGEIKNLEIAIDDALMVGSGSEKWGVRREVRSGKWDLVLVDLYLGKKYPKGAESEEFINGLKKILAKNGVVIFNRLAYGDLKKEAIQFSEKLRKYFPKVWTKKAVTNLLIFCQN